MDQLDVTRNWNTPRWSHDLHRIRSLSQGVGTMNKFKVKYFVIVVVAASKLKTKKKKKETVPVEVKEGRKTRHAVHGVARLLMRGIGGWSQLHGRCLLLGVMDD